MSIQRVLIADDDSLSREFLSEACRTFGLQIEAVASGEAALERLRRGGIDLVLTDLRMPGISGVELVRTMSKELPEVPVVLITAHGTVETAVQALQLGAADFVVKPCSPQTLELVIKRLDRTRRLERENEYLRTEAGLGDPLAVIAESKPMQELLRTAERLASSKGTVLITGESGTGKERVAHFLHHRSPRKSGPFIRVNCAALPEQLLESELFGHERGAFTGAHKRREGRFELADGGTILLDEIGEISPAVQAKLLRVLEEEEFERVGGTSTLEVDVRVIATTNRELPEEVAAGRFREDLYYRLHVLPLHIAPLRERMEDVLPLAKHFVGVHAKAAGIAVPSFSPEAEKRLLEWHWPGNVRELENAIHRAVVLVEGATIEPDHLNFQLMPRPNARPKFTLVTEKGQYLGAISANSPLANRTLDDLEREAILCTLEATRGNKTEAARRLQVTARTLSNKMKLWRQLGLVA
ncbi:MAG: sigma-54-dependent Fis family transcriptional regulator [Planctomycetes bacterium]|nr:sigma-54-dependent Fis family transcriptional regulator [Planctomycetota bacterium]